MDTPPEARYTNGMIGLIEIRRSRVTSLWKRARSRANTIQGRALFAPDRGPVDVISAPGTSGSKGSECSREYTSRDHRETHGSIIVTTPPGRRQRATSSKKRNGCGT